MTNEPKFEVPAEVRNMAERTIEQAEKAFDIFFQAANKSMAPLTYPGAEISKKALSLTEQNMKAAFETARKITMASSFQEAMQIQSSYLKSQFANAQDQLKQVTSAATDSVAHNNQAADTKPSAGKEV